MKSIKSSHLFVLGLAIKIPLLFYFASPYMRDLFIPFLDYAVQNPLSNPWSNFPPEHFPYGSVLFILLFIPKYVGYLLFGAASLGQGALSLALMKGPLLLIDALLFWTLLQFSTKSFRALVVYYWLNPALIFITYIHGQLDVVAMCFTFLSILFLSRDRLELSALAMAAATLSKFHIIVAVPFFVVYLWKKDFSKYAVVSIAKWVGIWGAVTAVGFLPIALANNVLYVTVASPQAGRIFGLQIPMGLGNSLLLGVSLMLLTLGRLCLSHRITTRGLLFGTGILFGVLLLITNPMPGWYFWTLPFLCLFYSTHYTNHPLIFWALVTAFLGYFGLQEFSSFPPNPLVGNIALTVLQTTVAAALAEMWLLVIRAEMPLQKSFKPLMIGIAGDSGVGKNMLSSVFADVLGEVNSLILEGDDYHRWERNREEWELYTHLNPRANHLPALAAHTEELMMGRFVHQPRYDHNTGLFTQPQTIRPAKTIIIQGLHALYLKDMRENLDLKIFLSAEKQVQLAWKIKRDVKERGHSLDNLLKSIEKREKDSALHINPQKNVADWQIEYRPAVSLTKKQILDGVQPEVYVKFILWNDSPWPLVAEPFKKNGECEVDVEEIEGDIDRVAVSIKGSPSKKSIETVAKAIFPNIRHITRSRREPVWRSGAQGLCQLMMLALIQNKVLNASIYKA